MGESTAESLSLLEASILNMHLGLGVLHSSFRPSRSTTPPQPHVVVGSPTGVAPRALHANIVESGLVVPL